MVINGVGFMEPSADSLLRWGADYGPLTTHGQWWRLLTATFVHVGLLHIATNMWCLWNLGLLGEPLLGPAGLIGVYLITGGLGNVGLVLAEHLFRTKRARLVLTTRSELPPRAEWENWLQE